MPSPAEPTPLPSAAQLATLLPPVLTARQRADLHGAGEPAGVLVLLFDIGDDPHLVLTKRTEYPGHHSGEVSLPGGRHEASDADLLATALRETHEEIGVRTSAVHVLGPLDDVLTKVSGFAVQPWVAHHPGGRPQFVPDPAEVAWVMEVRLADVLAAHHLIPPNPAFGQVRYPLLGEDVWGLTARILHTFAGVVQAATGRDA